MPPRTCGLTPVATPGGSKDDLHILEPPHIPTAGDLRPRAAWLRQAFCEFIDSAMAQDHPGFEARPHGEAHMGFYFENV